MCFGDSSTEKDKTDANKEFDDSKDGDRFKNGPAGDRECTDKFICLIFVLFMFVLVIISIVGFKDGDPLKLVTPYDASGNVCGETATYEDYPYVFWVDASIEVTEG